MMVVVSPQMALTQRKTAPPRLREGAVSNFLAFVFLYIFCFLCPLQDGMHEFRVKYDSVDRRNRFHFLNGQFASAEGKGILWCYHIP